MDNHLKKLVCVMGLEGERKSRGIFFVCFIFEL